MDQLFLEMVKSLLPELHEPAITSSDMNEAEDGLVESLHSKFSELISGRAMSNWWFDGQWALDNLTLSQKSKMAPAFFIDEFTRAPEVEVAADIPIWSMKLPYERFWICS